MTMTRFLRVLGLMAALVAARPGGVAADGSWLDHAAPAQWNRPGLPLPTVEAMDVEVVPGRRCGATARPPETAEDRAVAEAGWFLTGGYASGWGVRVVAGNAAFDGMCRPMGYQFFVFVDGAFGGTLSLEPMASRYDGAGSAPAVTTPEALVAEFARYDPGDTFCCPSGRSVAYYRIERADAGPVVWVSVVFSQRVSPR